LKGHTPSHSALKHLKDFSRGDVSFNEIDERWLEKFKEYLLGKVSQNSAQVYYQVLKRILNKAKREKIIITNPADFVDNIKSKDVKRDFLTEYELVKLAETPCKKQEIKRAFLFSCFTGLRFSDIKGLTWGNIDLHNDIIETRQQKTGEIIYIPLSDTAKDLLNSDAGKLHHLPNVPVFNLPDRWYYNYVLKKWFGSAMIEKNASSHIARHTFATLNITKGANIFTVSKLLGHKTLKTTEIYSKVIDDKKREAINKLPKLELGNGK